MVKRLNNACHYFPCHKGLEDCTFCYCPFYPCLDGKFGEYVHSQKLKKKVWSCQNCSRIHKKKIVDEIFKLIKQSGLIEIRIKDAGRPGSPLRPKTPPSPAYFKS